jgi:hypothetical protein
MVTSLGRIRLTNAELASCPETVPPAATRSTLVSLHRDVGERSLAADPRQPSERATFRATVPRTPQHDWRQSPCRRAARRLEPSGAPVVPSCPPLAGPRKEVPVADPYRAQSGFRP